MRHQETIAPLLDLPAPVNRPPAPDWSCWSCGRGPANRSGYCSSWETAGRANPWLGCTQPGCNTTRRRTYRGEQFFTCSEHTHQ